MNDMTSIKCWLCGGSHLKLQKEGIDPKTLSQHHFAITDANYGTTLTIYQCRDCGFLFCPDAGDVTPYYAALEDKSYEASRGQRRLQAKKLFLICKLQLIAI